MSFRAFLKTAESSINKLIEWNGIQPDLDSVKRELHTLKGTAMLFGASSAGREVFNLELFIRQNQSGDMRAAVRAGAETLSQKFSFWRTQELALFTKLGVFDDGKIEVSLRKLMDLKDRVSKKGDLKIDAAIEIVLKEINNTEFGDLLKDFESHVQSTARQIGKQVRFRVETPEWPIFINPEHYREALRSLIHVFNNSVDHGIETPEARKFQGKPAEGNITVRYNLFSDQSDPSSKKWIQVLIDDDGAGINVKKVAEKLKANGKSLPSGISDLDLASHVFDAGLSTRDAVDALSGQGVGMSAVQFAVNRMRGRIRVSKTGPQGTQFELLLPNLSISETLTLESRLQSA